MEDGYARDVNIEGKKDQLKICGDQKTVKRKEVKEMAVKYFCDRCNKELDGKNMDYVSIMIDNFSDDNSESEHWQFCNECALSVKRSMIKNIIDREDNKGE